VQAKEARECKQKRLGSASKRGGRKRVIESEGERKQNLPILPVQLLSVVTVV